MHAPSRRHFKNSFTRVDSEAAWKLAFHLLTYIYLQWGCLSEHRYLSFDLRRLFSSVVSDFVHALCVDALFPQLWFCLFIHLVWFKSLMTSFSWSLLLLPILADLDPLHQSFLQQWSSTFSGWWRVADNGSKGLESAIFLFSLLGKSFPSASSYGFWQILVLQSFSHLGLSISLGFLAFLWFGFQVDAKGERFGLTNLPRNYPRIQDHHS